MAMLFARRTDVSGWRRPSLPLRFSVRAVASRERRMFRKSKIEIVLPCSMEQACRRLTATMDASFFGFDYATGRPVIGRIRGRRLTARKRIRYRNSCQTYLSAEMIDRGNETLVRCRFSMHPFVIALVTFLFAGAVLVQVAAYVQRLIRPDPSLPPLVGLIFPFEFAILVGAALMIFGRWLARDEQAFLTDFVRAAGAGDTIQPPRSDHTAK
jgi:hypothetical protein